MPVLRALHQLCGICGVGLLDDELVISKKNLVQGAAQRLFWRRPNQVPHGACACFQILEVLEEGVQGWYQAADRTQTTPDDLTALQVKAGKYL
ncbi:hypothetical protein V498_08223, partial [Pseudogymnoascus sp. VKM F-4517 (FW-2822)]